LEKIWQQYDYLKMLIFDEEKMLIFKKKNRLSLYVKISNNTCS